MIVGLLRDKDWARLRVRYRDDAYDDLVLREGVRHEALSDADKIASVIDGQAGDLLAARLVLAWNAGLVEHFVRREWRGVGFVSGGLGPEDLRQEARIGLLRALERFDPTRGVAFSTYAGYWIRHRINRYLEDHISQVRVPVWARAAYRTNKERRQALRTHIREAVEAARHYVDVESLSLAVADVDDSKRSMLRAIRRTMRALHHARVFTDRDVEILMRRYTSPGETLEEVGVSLGLTRERVRQIEELLIAMLRAGVAAPDGEEPSAARLARSRFAHLQAQRVASRARSSTGRDERLGRASRYPRPAGEGGRMIDPLTPRQLEVLAFIFRRECAGSIATWREIMAAIGVRSTNAVACLVRLLERKGYLAPVHGLKRAIRVTAIPVFSGDPAQIIGFIPRRAA